MGILVLILYINSNNEQHIHIIYDLWSDICSKLIGEGYIGENVLPIFPTLEDIFTGDEIRGFLEKIPILSYQQNFDLHFKIPQIHFSVISSKSVKMRCIYQISYFTWSVRQGRTFFRYIIKSQFEIR